MVHFKKEGWWPSSSFPPRKDLATWFPVFSTWVFLPHSRETPLICHMDGRSVEGRAWNGQLCTNYT